MNNTSNTNDGLYPQERNGIETEITVIEELISKFRTEQKNTTELKDTLDALLDSLSKLDTVILNEG